MQGTDENPLSACRLYSGCGLKKKISTNHVDAVLLRRLVYMPVSGSWPISISGQRPVNLGLIRFPCQTPLDSIHSMWAVVLAGG